MKILLGITVFFFCMSRGFFSSQILFLYFFIITGFEQLIMMHLVSFFIYFLWLGLIELLRSAGLYFFITFGKFSTIISSNVFFCNPFSLLCFRDSNYIHGRPLEVVPQITDNTVHFSKFFLCFFLNRFYSCVFILVSCVHDFSSAGLTCHYLSTYFSYIQ